MARADVDSAAITGHSVAGDSRMFLTRAIRACAAPALTDEATSLSGAGAGPAGATAGPAGAGSGRGATAAADIGSVGAAAEDAKAAIAAPQKLQNLAPSGTCLPHWPQNIDAALLDLRARGGARTGNFALGLRGIQPPERRPNGSASARNAGHT